MRVRMYVCILLNGKKRLFPLVSRCAIVAVWCSSVDMPAIEKTATNYKTIRQMCTATRSNVTTVDSIGCTRRRMNYSNTHAHRTRVNEQSTEREREHHEYHFVVAYVCVNQLKSPFYFLALVHSLAPSIHKFRVYLLASLSLVLCFVRVCVKSGMKHFLKQLKSIRPRNG